MANWLYEEIESYSYIHSSEEEIYTHGKLVIPAAAAIVCSEEET